VGIVWTDGGNPISFEARNAANTVITSLSGSHADGSFNGETAEDRFYGVFNPSGVFSITVANPGGLEVDHLQYGFASLSSAAPEPASVGLLGFGLVFGLRRRRR
jgi:hypothetical protein